MTTSDREKLKLDLMRDEGLRLKPYLDTVGKSTIGYGRNLSDKGISHDEAQFLLETDLDEVLTDCATFPWFAGLDGVRQRAIANLRFNLGQKGFRKFKNTIAAMARGDYSAAAANLRLSKWYQQVKSRGPRIVGMVESGREPL